jgi:hypothetical protein
MTAARKLLDWLAEIGATVEPAGDDRLIVRAGAKPIPGELVQQLGEAKAEILAAITPPGRLLELDPDSVTAPAWLEPRLLSGRSRPTSPRPAHAA